LAVNESSCSLSQTTPSFYNRKGRLLLSLFHTFSLQSIPHRLGSKFTTCTFQYFSVHSCFLNFVSYHIIEPNREVSKPPISSSLPPTTVFTSIEMDASTLVRNLRVQEWVEHLCDDQAAAHEVIQAQYCSRSHGKTPLCDKLIARGVLRSRDARPWAETTEDPPTGATIPPHRTTAEHLGTRLALAQPRANTVGAPALVPTDNQECKGRINRKCADEVTCEDTMDHQFAEHQDWVLATTAFNNKSTRVAANRRIQSSRAHYSTSEGGCHYLSFLESFGSLLLTCSTTLAAYSAEVFNKPKPILGAQQKEFVEYFDIV